RGPHRRHRDVRRRERRMRQWARRRFRALNEGNADHMSGAQESTGSVDGYRERLTPSLLSFVAAAVIAPMAALVIAPVNAVVALIVGVAVAALVIALLIALSP